MKLHIGCGDHMLKGWINTDLNGYSTPMGSVWHLDATGIFPYKSNYFSYIFSEHMIEHIDFAAAQQMLKECYRVLVPGGKIRISCPDMAFIIKLISSCQKLTELEKQYVDWANNIFGLEDNIPRVNVAYNLQHGFGHKHIYSKMSLGGCMINVGFNHIKEQKILESEDPELQGLEHTSRMPEGFLQLETMTLEGTKP